MAVGVVEGHTQMVGVRRLTVPGVVDVSFGLRAREVQRKGEVQAGGSVDQVDRIAGAILPLLELPAPHRRALVADGDVIKVRLHDEWRLYPLRRGVDLGAWFRRRWWESRGRWRGVRGKRRGGLRRCG